MCAVTLLTPKKEQNRMRKHQTAVMSWDTEDYMQYQNRLINSFSSKQENCHSNVQSEISSNTNHC